MSAPSLKYFAGTILYGITRKIALLNYSSTYEVYGKDGKRKKEMLVGDKLLVIGLSASVAPIFWPKFLHDDLNIINIVYRDEKLEDYGYDFKSMYDYMY